jgi:hypothetical protein
MASKKFRKLAILAKIETSRGVDAVPTGAANAMIVSEATLSPLEGDVAERNNVQPYYGQNGSVQATSYRKLSFKVEAAGGGAVGTAPKYGPLLRGCGASETVSAGVSVTYAPISDSQETLSIYCNIDGINHVMLDAHGSAKLMFSAKGFPYYQFDFTGLFVALTDTALPATVYTGFVKPLPMNKANTIITLHSVAVACSKWDFDMGNQVVKRDLTGVDSVEITDRKSTGSIVFENTAIATKDWVATAKATTLGDMSVVHGTTAGNIITFTATATCEVSKPTYSNEDGIQMMNLQQRFIPTSAGNDEWSLVLT